MPDDGIEYALHLAVELSRDAVASVAHEDHLHPEDTVGTMAAVFFVGLEMGMRLGITAGSTRTKDFLKRLTSSAKHFGQEPLEIRERMMGNDIDNMLGVAVLDGRHCPDCRSDEILFDEANWHLVCAGCGQLVRERPA